MTKNNRQNGTCYASGCTETAKHSDPKGDEDIANANVEVNHNVNFIALNPHIGTKTVKRGGCSTPRTTTTETCLNEEAGIYLCDDHIHLAGEIIDQLVEGKDE